MPKLKRVSSLLAASRAKKQKRLRVAEQDSDGRDREESRRERNTEARRIARLDPLRRQQEQVRNTAVRRQIRQEDPEKRQEEQTRDTGSSASTSSSRGS